MDSAALIVREKEPLNVESPACVLDSFLTPNDLFFIRNHFPIPRLNPESYRLRVDGAVADPLRISYEELRAMPSRTSTVTLECAGNGRSFLQPRKSGVPWELGAIGTAEWTGVPLAHLLRRAGVDDGAVAVFVEGADRGEPTNDPKPDGEIAFARTLPIEKAQEPDVLLAYRMNARDLTPEHGFPVRAIVPGYYGMASVKWITHIEVLREWPRGYWETSEYSYWDAAEGRPIVRPLDKIRVKSAIVRPRMHEIVRPNMGYRVTGAAWSGTSEIAKVELSVDGGETWNVARLLDASRRYAWRRWEYEWRTPAQSRMCVLLSRARDSTGATQPDHHDANYGSYAINYTLPVEVFVRSSMRSSGIRTESISGRVENLVGETLL
ncbi:MAG: sulfite oxidase [Acidobacteriaceae bacterium]|nr:sulfite oxidase [Acidobacteriaceae bacterium]MBV9780165.1 sulfite oxidase [Acidobacteriaceae bacterium]